MSSPAIGAMLALTTAIFWGILPIAMKQVLEVMSPATIVWYRFVVAFIGLGLWLAWRKNLPMMNTLNTKKVSILIVASLGLAANFVLFNSGLQYLAPPVVQVIIQLAPVILLLTNAWLFKEKLGLHQIIGVSALFAGLMLFFNDRLIELVSSLSTYTLGVIITIFAALTWVVYGLAQKRLLQEFTSAQILFVVYGLCAVLITPFADIEQITLVNSRQAWLLVFCCLNTLVAYGAFAEALARWQAAPVSALITLTPLFTIVFVDVFAMFWPKYVEHVSLNTLAYIGAFVVVAGAMFCAAGHKLIRIWSSKI